MGRPSRRKYQQKTGKQNPEQVASELRTLLAKVGLQAHPQLVLWIFENSKLLHWIRWNDPAWLAKFDKDLKDPEYVSWFEERRKEPAWSEWQEDCRTALEKLAPLAEQAKKFLAIYAIFPQAHMDRWKELQTEREAIAERAHTIMTRCDELRPMLESGVDISAEIKTMEHSFNTDEVRLAKIEAELEPLNREIDLLGATYPEWFPKHE